MSCLIMTRAIDPHLPASWLWSPQSCDRVFVGSGVVNPSTRASNYLEQAQGAMCIATATGIFTRRRREVSRYIDIYIHVSLLLNDYMQLCDKCKAEKQETCKNLTKTAPAPFIHHASVTTNTHTKVRNRRHDALPRVAQKACRLKSSSLTYRQICFSLLVSIYRKRLPK
jgi:hypothetical protein